MRVFQKTKYSLFFGIALSGQVKFPDGYPEKSNTVISIEKAGEKAPAPIRAQIDQFNMVYIPHVTVVSPGSTLVFTNRDPTIHGIKSVDGPLQKLHFVMVPKRKAKTFVVQDTGVSELLCDIHAQMHAFVLVLNTGYYALSDAEGKFSFGQLPAPPFTVKVWHPVLPPQDFDVKSPADFAKITQIQLKTWDN